MAEDEDVVALLVADIYESAGLLRRAGEAISAAEGQSQARWQVMSVVSDRPLSVPQAARRLGQTRQAVQRVANDLVAAGIVRMEPNPDHRTSPLLEITAEGRRVLARITERARRFHDELEIPVGEEDLRTARRVLRQISQRLVDRKH